MSTSFLSIAKPLFILLFSGISLTSLSQCPTTLTQSVVSQSGNQLVIQPVFDIAPPSEVMNGTLSNGVTSYSVLGMTTSTITYTNITAGSYSVCLNANFSTSGCPPLTHCMPVTVSGTTICPTVLTPSIMANSGGLVRIMPAFNVVPSSGVMSQWMNSGLNSYTATTTSIMDIITHTNVAAGNYSVCLQANSLNSGCASLTGCIQITVAASNPCPTVLTPSIVTNSGGQVSILPVFDVVPTSGVITQWMDMGLNSYTATTTSMTNVITHTNVAAGTTYSLCLQASSLNSGCPSVSGCIYQVTVAASNPCPTVLTPSIVTNSPAQVSILPVFDVVPFSGLITSSMTSGTNSYSLSSTSMTNVISHYSVTPGNYNVCLYASSLNSGCPNVSGCAQVFVWPVCQPGFTYSTDVNCVTHFINTSTGASLTHHWDINGVTYTTTDVSVSLPNGSYQVELINNTMTGPSSYISCDTLNQTVSVLCPTTSTLCSANASFSVSPDPATPGHYFVYDISTATGTRSYLWDFGDGTTSTQQHPVHQYATPGQYVICLTVSGTSGTVSCSSTRCDSSSVRRVASGFFMSQVTVVPGTPTSLKEKDATEHLNVYPNPVSESLTLDLGILNQTLHYVLTDIYGRMVIEGEITGPKTTVNTSLLPNGFYILNITNATGDSLKTVKIVK